MRVWEFDQNPKDVPRAFMCAVVEARKWALNDVEILVVSLENGLVVYIGRGKFGDAVFAVGGRSAVVLGLHNLPLRALSEFLSRERGATLVISDLQPQELARMLPELREKLLGLGPSKSRATPRR